MAGLESRIHVRRAQYSDYGPVVDINPEVYDGLDYLPTMYMEFINNPSVSCYVIELHDKVVGFRMLQTFDDGCGVVSMASRVSPHVQGLGIYATLNTSSMQLFKEDNPHVEYKTRMALNLPSNARELAKPDSQWTLQREWDWLVYDVNTGTLDDAIENTKECGVPSARDINREDLRRFLKQPTLITQIFGTGLIPSGANWFPTPLKEQSLLNLALTHRVVASFNNK